MPHGDSLDQLTRAITLIEEFSRRLSESDLRNERSLESIRSEISNLVKEVRNELNGLSDEVAEIAERVTRVEGDQKRSAWAVWLAVGAGIVGAVSAFWKKIIGVDPS